MGRRHADRLYAGAKSRLTLERAAALTRRHVLQPKLDGSYGVISTDRQGAITSIVTRSGKVLGPELMAHFRGIRWAPASTVIGEVEVWTEAAERHSQRRGYRRIWLFDALRVDGEQLGSEPYSTRRDRLMWAESVLVNMGCDRPWKTDATDRAHDAAGRFCRKVPGGWRRMPVVPQRPAHQLEQAWSEWVDAGEEPIEGLVVVATDAPIGRRNAKRKIKPSLTLDCTVVESEGKLSRVTWAGGDFFVQRELDVGDVIEVVCDGLTEKAGRPKFPRVLRRRPDLVG